MARNSISIVANSVRVPTKTMKRRDQLEMGDVFKLVGDGYKRLYMHTGIRTAPPSGVNVEVTVNGKSIPVQAQKSLGRTSNGDHIVGFQSIIVQGSPKPGEDGAVVSFDPTHQVEVVGKAKISLELNA